MGFQLIDVFDLDNRIPFAAGQSPRGFASGPSCFGQLVKSAPLGGTILPTVRTTDATAADGAYPATVFNALVRQSPWLIADAHTAPAITNLLTSVAELRLVAAPS